VPAVDRASFSDSSTFHVHLVWGLSSGGGALRAQPPAKLEHAFSVRMSIGPTPRPIADAGVERANRIAQRPVPGQQFRHPRVVIAIRFPPRGAPVGPRRQPSPSDSSTLHVHLVWGLSSGGGALRAQPPAKLEHAFSVLVPIRPKPRH
jgi:hypothetical protein